MYCNNTFGKCIQHEIILLAIVPSWVPRCNEQCESVVSIAASIKGEGKDVSVALSAIPFFLDVDYFIVVVSFLSQRLFVKCCFAAHYF